MTHAPNCKTLDHLGYTCAAFAAIDPINHPPHYTQHPSGVECITITEHYNFNVGNAIKYLWRAGLKDGADATDDLRKAAWYVQREIDRIGQPVESDPMACCGRDIVTQGGICVDCPYAVCRHGTHFDAVCDQCNALR